MGGPTSGVKPSLCRKTPPFSVLRYFNFRLPSTNSFSSKMSTQNVSESPTTTKASESSPAESPHEPVRLCKTCRGAHYESLRQYRDFQHTDNITPIPKHPTLPTDEWPNLPRLLGSAQAGCGFCGFLREAILSGRFNDALNHLSQGSVTESDHKRLHFELHYGSTAQPPYTLSPSYDIESLIVKVTFEQGASVYMNFTVEAIDGEQPGLTIWTMKRFLLANLLSDSPAVEDLFNIRPQAIRNHEDDEITSFLRGELMECLEAPDEYDSNPYYLPERLIDVEINSMRLVERNNIRANLGERYQYCALSYCWGPPEDARSQTKATSENIQQCLESLTYESLSPVLKDAVKTARSLSIPYLWVDSLCILQDDVSDWQRQCGQMNEIYGNARVTLIAASSRTCNEGFLNPKQHGLQFPYQLDTRPEVNGSFMIYFTHAFSEVESRLHSELGADLHNDLKCSQWARRGWTFQEEAMARARIVFGHFGVYFGLDDEYVSNDMDFAGKINLEPVTSLQKKDDLHQTWETAICHYTAFTPSSFTEPTDLLPALSGLARLFGDKLQEKYLAGHWADRLHLTLLWMHDLKRGLKPSLDAIIKGHREKPYLIPTWSCLTRGNISFQLDCNSNVSSEITVADSHISLIGDNPYGAIQDASLTIDGFVLDLASLTWDESPDSLVGSQAVGSHPQIRLRRKAYLANKVWFRLVESEIASESYDYGLEDYVYRLDLDFQAVPGDQSPLDKTRALFEQLISRVKLLLVASGDDIIGGAHGLLLVPLESGSERSFLRVGTFTPRVYGQQGSIPCLKRLMKRETVKLL